MTTKHHPITIAALEEALLDLALHVSEMRGCKHPKVPGRGGTIYQRVFMLLYEGAQAPAKKRRVKK